MGATSDGLRVEPLALHPELFEQLGLLRWKEWSYGEKDVSSFVRVTAREAGDGTGLPLSLVAIDATGNAVGVVGLGEIDDEVSVTERAGRTPWILGMVVDADRRMTGIGRRLLEGLQQAAASLGHPQTWVATGKEAVDFYQRCGWSPVEHLVLASTGIPTTILVKPTAAQR